MACGFELWTSWVLSAKQLLNNSAMMLPPFNFQFILPHKGPKWIKLILGLSKARQFWLIKIKSLRFNWDILLGLLLYWGISFVRVICWFCFNFNCCCLFFASVLRLFTRLYKAKKKIGFSVQTKLFFTELQNIIFYLSYQTF